MFWLVTTGISTALFYYFASFVVGLHPKSVKMVEVATILVAILTFTATITVLYITASPKSVKERKEDSIKTINKENLKESNLIVQGDSVFYKMDNGKLQKLNKSKKFKYETTSKEKTQVTLKTVKKKDIDMVNFSPVKHPILWVDIRVTNIKTYEVDSIAISQTEFEANNKNVSVKLED